MHLVVISPEADRADEHAVLAAMFRAGLGRYHVRKPHTSADQLARWIEGVPACWRPRLVLHQHHQLVATHGLGGWHWRDDRAAGATVDASAESGTPSTPAMIRSRSCHEVTTLRASLAQFDSVFFGPVFPSLSKPGYGPTNAGTGEMLRAALAARTAGERRTVVFAIGGITVETAPRARELGFDGVAVLGAIWQAPDPESAFHRLWQSDAMRHAAAGLARAGDPDRPAPVFTVTAV